MWLADNGRQFRTSERSKCRPKLVIIDIETKNVLHVHEFPDNVVSKTNSFLNDIVLDISDPNDKFVYISDSNEGVIIVYSHKLNKSWKAEHSSMKADPKVRKIY